MTQAIQKTRRQDEIPSNGEQSGKVKVPRLERKLKGGTNSYTTSSAISGINGCAAIAKDPAGHIKHTDF